MADAFWISRHFAEPACLGVIFHFAQNIIEFPIGNVPLHLIACHAVVSNRLGRRRVPFVVVPPVQPRCELGALFE